MMSSASGDLAWLARLFDHTGRRCQPLSESSHQAVPGVARLANIKALFWKKVETPTHKYAWADCRPMGIDKSTPGIYEHPDCVVHTPLMIQKSPNA